MNSIKKYIIVFSIIQFLVVNITYAYEVPVHKALSKKIVREYMRKNTEPIQYLEQIRKGSADGDEHPWYGAKKKLKMLKWVLN